MSRKTSESAEEYSNGYQVKLVVHKRDQCRCLNCREVFEENPDKLDADHNVSSGQGGSNAISNRSSLCRRCHKAKHEERPHAPTIRFVSTQDMPNKDFRWFEHLWKEQFPALTNAILDYRIEPIFDISDATYRAWHIPLGDLRRLDEKLAGLDDVEYAPMSIHHYM